MLTRASIIFIGNVQGVYFRAYAERFATAMGVCGWVMNEPDGSVSSIMEGEREDIEEVIRRLVEEHPHARVDDIRIEWQEPQGLRGFTIRH